MIKGVDAVLNNLNKEISGIKGRSIAGLLEAGLAIQGVAQKRAPLETGNLRGSAYTRRGMFNPNTVEIGFTAIYAAAVHEDMEATHTVGQAKYLESAVRDNETRVLDIIQRRAKVST